MEIHDGKYCIYCHTNKVNGKKYIGQTCQKPARRWRKGNGYKSSTYFYHAIQKYGWDGFDHEIVASHLTKKEADNFERLLIKKLNTNNAEFGYNLSSGGEGSSGVVFSEETRKIISENGKRNGYKIIYNGKQYDNAKRLGEEIGVKYNTLRSWMNGVNIAPLWFSRSEIFYNGEKLNLVVASEEERRNLKGLHIREQLAKREKPIKPPKEKKSRLKPVEQIDKNGNIISVYSSQKEAYEKTGIPVSGISSCCHNHRKAYRGYIWRFKIP